MVRIWTQQAQEQRGAVRLSPILPVVLAQDKRSWKISERFGDLFALTQQRWEEVGAFTPDFAFRLLQLVDIPYEKIGGTAEGILTLRALKAEAVGELLHEAVWEPGLLQAVSLEAAERFFRYMLNAGIDKQTFERRVRQVNNLELLQQAMTLADQYRQEGLQQGMTLADQYRREGIEHGQTRALRCALVDVLVTRFDSVPEGLRDRVEEITDSETLTALLKSAVRCERLEDFVQSL